MELSTFSATLLLVSILTSVILFLRFSIPIILGGIFSYLTTFIPVILTVLTAVTVLLVAHFSYEYIKQRRAEKAYANSFVGTLTPVYISFQEVNTISAKQFVSVSEKILAMVRERKGDKRKLNDDLTTEFYIEMQSLREVIQAVNSGVPLTHLDIMNTMDVITERLNEGYTHYLTEATLAIRREREVLQSLTQEERAQQEFFESTSNR